MGGTRLKIKTDLNYRRGTTSLHCSGCDSYVPDFEVKGIGSKETRKIAPRCKVIGLENSKLYEVSPNSLCDSFDNTQTLKRLTDLSPTMSKEVNELDQKQETDVVHILVTRLLPNPYQPETRIDMDLETAKKFGQSIKEHGLIMMPVVRPAPGVVGAYEVGDGWLRTSGFRYNSEILGLEEYKQVPCVVKNLTNQQMADMVMEANTVRKDLNPIELAAFYKKYLEDFDIPQAELARRRNCSQGEIANTIRLLELPAEIQSKIISREITETHGRQLLRLNIFPQKQKESLDRTINMRYTVTQLDTEIQSTLWFNTRPLHTTQCSFKIETCDECPKRVMAANPHGVDKKEYRCPDVECWNKKQDDAEKARADKKLKKINKAAGTDKLLTSNDIGYNQYERLQYGRGDLDNPEECDTCESKAYYKYRADSPGEPELICLKPNCHRGKKTKKTKAENKIRRDNDQKITGRISATLQNDVDLHEIAVILATDQIHHIQNQDGSKEFRTHFPDMPPAGKHGGRDDKAIHEWLSGKTLDELLKLAAVTYIVRRRRTYSGEISDKLSPDVNHVLAVMAGTAKKGKITEEEESVDSLETTNNSLQEATSPLIPPAGSIPEQHGYIPEGIRLSRDVSSSECAGCGLDTEDHTLDGKYVCTENLGDTYYKVCLKDYYAKFGKPGDSEDTDIPQDLEDRLDERDRELDAADEERLAGIPDDEIIVYQCPICWEAGRATLGGQPPEGWKLRTFEKGEIWVCPECELMTICRVCGCSQNNPCEEGCWWVESDLCSECAVPEPAV